MRVEAESVAQASFIVKVAGAARAKAMEAGR